MASFRAASASAAMASFRAASASAKRAYSACSSSYVMPGTMFGLRSTFGSSDSDAAESSGSGAAESSGSGAAESSDSGAAESSVSGAASSPRASPISLAASAASASSEIAPSSRALAADTSAGSNRSSRVSSSKAASSPSDAPSSAASSAASRSVRSLSSSAMAKSRRASSSSAFPSPVCFDATRLFGFRAAEDRAARSRSSSGRGFANARVASKSSASLSRSSSRERVLSSPRRLFLPNELSARVFSIPQSSLRPPERFRETSSRLCSAAARPRSATAGFARAWSRSNDGSEKNAADVDSVETSGFRLDPRRARMADSAVGVGPPATSAPPAMTSAPNATPATTPRVTDQGVCSRARDGAGAACEGRGEGGEVSTARPRGEACRPGRGRGRSGAVGGGRTRLEVPHDDPARPSRPPREARWTRGGPAAMPREPRKCLLRAGWRRDDRAGRERRTRGGLDAPSPGLLARCAARSRSGTLGRATAPPLCAPWRVRVCRVPLRVGM